MNVPSDDDDPRAYTVVVNGEEQYSIWPMGKPLPAGWRECGQTGNTRTCLAYVEHVWTDMRPLSLRLRSDERERHAERPT